MVSTGFQYLTRDYKPEKFTAKPSENAREWLLLVDQYFNVMKLTSVERVAAASMMMDGLARKWSLTVPAAPENKDPWEHFGTRFVQRFGSNNNQLFAKQKLHQLKQTGSVTKYNLQFETLRLQIDDLPESQALDYYLMGLKPKLQEHFASITDMPTDLGTVMAIAERIDNVQYRILRNSHSFQSRNEFKSSSSHSESFPQPMELDAMFGQDDEKQKKLDLKNRTCFLCHSTGHQIRNCPKNPKSGKALSH
ncbi:hypothetical protein BGZ96_004701 [Linnemannia gamsii]|jgi:hypothetical protein|uniref:CCHC-type domain-containing protein n=1 Tax=Linnemannia gamsii TaxID=64522 RepID=A0ABQ7JHV4_9FUNG|nr:hypothetical protein BGZ96_004701 [Linnemannia gamsii]